MTLVVLTFLAVFVLVASGALLLGYRQAIQSRLSRAGSPLRGATQPVGEIYASDAVSTIDRLADPFQKLVPRSPNEVSVAQRRLFLAGFRQDRHLDLFFASKLIVPIVLAILVTVTGLYQSGAFVVYACTLALGFILPDFWVGHKLRQRQVEINFGLSEALDLMTVCVEAGLGIDQAILRVADELQLSRPEIAEELGMVNLEQRAGKSRTEALRNLADRTDVNAVREWVAMLIQTEQFGTSIAEALRVHSDTLRVQRTQEVEELAAKLPVKMVFPLAFFVFPSMFVVTLAPALIRIMDNFGKSFQ